MKRPVPKPAVMLDYKYREVGTLNQEWHEAMRKIPQPKSECLSECVVAFRANMDRINCLMRLPGELCHDSRRDTLWLCNAVNKVKGVAEYSLEQIAEHCQDPAVKAEVERQCALAPRRTVGQQIERVRRFGVIPIEQRLQSGSPAFEGDRQAMVAVYAACVLGAWTAFECLAADLWCAGVDNLPKEEADLIVLELEQPNKKRFAPSEIRSGEFELSTHPGSFLREHGYAVMQKLETTKTLYKTAFGPEVMQLFDKTFDGRIFELFATRNLLTHRSGIADWKFLNEVKRFGNFTAAEKGKPILLDGSIVSALVRAGMLLGGALVDAVDGVLTSH